MRRHSYKILQDLQEGPGQTQEEGMNERREGVCAVAVPAKEDVRMFFAGEILGNDWQNFSK